MATMQMAAFFLFISSNIGTARHECQNTIRSDQFNSSRFMLICLLHKAGLVTFLSYYEG